MPGDPLKMLVGEPQFTAESNSKMIHITVSRSVIINFVLEQRTKFLVNSSGACT